MSEPSETQVSGRPLCVFCMSPPYSIRSISSSHSSENLPAASRRCLESYWRPGAYSFRSIRRSRRRNIRRRRSSPLIRTVAGLIRSNQPKFLDLEEILDTVQAVWQSPEKYRSNKTDNTNNMEQSSQKSSPHGSNEISPMLLRRRLSAPETVMRKHVLAQERSHSQESRNPSWEQEITATSDPNLLRKRDSSFIRKSTLLRRLWNNNNNKNNKSSPSRISASFNESQYISGKLYPRKSTQSLTSSQSSPEHKSKSQETPQRRTSLSPRKSSSQYAKNINLSPKRSQTVFNGNSSEPTTNNSLYSNLVSQIPKSLCKDESESTTTKYTYSSFTTFSDNSDSAFSNSSLTNRPSSTINSGESSETITKCYEENAENFNEEGNETLQIKIENQDIKDISQCATSNNESSTQTPDITNLNVISNVKLSQLTLDVIFNQIMQEVNNLVPGDVNINTTTIATNIPKTENAVSSETQLINVQSQPQKKMPSFFLKTKEEENPEHARLDKYIISNVKSGSCYSKPTEIPHVVVPRYSALPRTLSMEVNTSNGNSEEKDESDSVSLVDSLEDFNSPRIKHHDDKIVRGLDVTQLLPEGVEKKREAPRKKSASMFYIPIEVSKKKENKAVSDLLPHKVREKLSRRQQKREEKNQQSKVKLSSDSNYISASDNGTQTYLYDDTESENNDYSPKTLSYAKPHKPFLPNIESVKNKIEKQMRKCKMKEKKSKPTNRQSEENVVKRKHSIYTTAPYKPKKKSSENNVYESEPTKIYQKTEYKNSRKRIEILEITECIDTTEKPTTTYFKQSKEKSKIPVPVNHQSTSKNSKEQSFLFGFGTGNELNDTKLDRLIANILIDTLNSSSNIETRLTPSENKKHNEETIPTKHHLTPKYKQKFEIIPEEISFQSTEEHTSNQNEAVDNSVATENYDKKSENHNSSSYQGRAAVGLMQDENFTAIPKGWITFYTLQKDVGTPDSTSDEGKHLDNSVQNPSELKAIMCDKPNDNKHLNTNSSNRAALKDNNSDIIQNTKVGTFLHSRYPSQNMENVNGFQRRPKLQLNDQQNNNPCNIGEWSVTISGTNTYNQSAPDVEMRLKFPQKNANEINKEFAKHRDLGPEIENNMTERLSSCFPKINLKDHQNQARDKRKAARGQDIFHESLPRIQTQKQNQKETNSVISLYHNIIPSVIIPRQNKASTGRYNYSRPIREQYNLPNVASICDIERQYAHVVQKFPDMLSVTGRSISPERKSTVTSLSEKDL